MVTSLVLRILAEFGWIKHPNSWSIVEQTKIEQRKITCIFSRHMLFALYLYRILRGRAWATSLLRILLWFQHETLKFINFGSAYFVSSLFFFFWNYFCAITLARERQDCYLSTTYKWNNESLSGNTVASFTKKVNSKLAKRPLIFNWRLVYRGLTSLAKEHYCVVSGVVWSGTYSIFNRICLKPGVIFSLILSIPPI